MAQSVDIAIVAAAASVAGGLMSALAVTVVEFMRGRNERLREAAARQHESDAALEQGIRDAMSAVRVTSLAFGLNAKRVMSLRLAAQTEDSVAEPSLQTLREQYVDAIQAAEALWVASDDRLVRKSVESLRLELSRLLQCVEGFEVAPDVDAMDSVLLHRLRLIGLAIYPTGHGRDDYEYQRILEAVSEDKRKLGF